MNPLILVCVDAGARACRGCGGDVESGVRQQTEIDGSGRRAETRGLLWVVGAFVICPCHLPVTLGVAAALLGGTAAGTALHGHPLVAGLGISATWLAATWHGFRLLNSAQAGRGVPSVEPREGSE